MGISINFHYTGEPEKAPRIPNSLGLKKTRLHFFDAGKYEKGKDKYAVFAKKITFKENEKIPDGIKGRFIYQKIGNSNEFYKINKASLQKRLGIKSADLKSITNHRYEELIQKNLFAKMGIQQDFNQVDKDMEKVSTSMYLKLQDFGNIPIHSAKCIVKTDFKAHTQQSNFTVETPNNVGNLFKKLESINNIHIQQCKKLPYGVPLKTEWAWIIEDQDMKEISCYGDLTSTDRGVSIEFGKSGSSVDFRI